MPHKAQPVPTTARPTINTLQVQHVEGVVRPGCLLSFQGLPATAFGIDLKSDGSPLTYWAKKGKKGALLMTCRQPYRCPRIAPITGFTRKFTPNQVTRGKGGNP